MNYPLFHSAKRAGELHNLSRNHPRGMMGLLTGHCHLKGHVYKMVLVDSSEQNRCKPASETASHVLCHCEALATWALISRNQVTLLISLSASYCWMLKQRVAQQIRHSWKARVTVVPALLYCTVLYCTTLPHSTISLLLKFISGSVKHYTPIIYSVTSIVNA